MTVKKAAIRKPACKDCGSTSRPLPHPGPRCATCHRAEQKRRKGAAHERHVSRTYGLRPGDYDALYVAQGGKCFICQHAIGKARRLAVDHDHKHCGTGCLECVRGLLCSPCNKDVIGRLGIDALLRAVDYLTNPPARAVLLGE